MRRIAPGASRTPGVGILGAVYRLSSKLAERNVIAWRTSVQLSAGRTRSPAKPARSTRASGARSPYPPGPPPRRCRRARPWPRTAGSFLEEGLERGPEVRGRAANGVDVCTQLDAVLEAQAVELVELLLGEREGGGARRREGAQHFTDLLLEVGVFVHARHEAQLRGFGCRQDPAGRREIERDLFSDGPLEQGHDDGGHEAALHFRIAELRRLGCDQQVACRREAAAARQRPPVHDRDDGLRQLPDPDEDLAEAQRGLAVLLHRFVRRSEQLVQIHAGAKVGPAAVERSVQQEVQRHEVRQLVALDRARDHPLEVLRDAGRGHLFHEDGIIFGLERDQPDVRGVAFVPRAGVGELEERDATLPRPPSTALDRPRPPSHTSTISTHGSTIRLSTSAGQYATISSGLGRPPANPVTLGGPLRMSGAISRVKRSTAAASEDRTPIRSCTSGSASRSALSSARAPCVASAPTNSVRIASNSSPRALRRCRTTPSAAFALL